MAKNPMKDMPEMEDDKESGPKKMELELTVYGKETKKAKGGMVKKATSKKSKSKVGTGIDSGMKSYSPIARPQKFSGLY